MNPSDSSSLTVKTLLALRREDDAIRIISERLQVKKMGPADHIRTKHEVKAFVESGDLKAAEALIRQAQQRASIGHTQTATLAEYRGQDRRIET